MAPKRVAGQQQAAGISSKKASAGKRQLTEAVTPQLRTSKRSRTAGAPVALTVCFAPLLIIATDDSIYSPLAQRPSTYDEPRLRPAETSDVSDGKKHSKNQATTSIALFQLWTLVANRKPLCLGACDQGDPCFALHCCQQLVRWLHM